MNGTVTREAVHEYIRLRDIARVFQLAEIPVPSHMVTAIAEYDRQIAVYLEQRRLLFFAASVAGGIAA